MFDKKEIDLYHSITAPDSLRNRVFDKSNNRPIRIWYKRRFTLTAACLVLFFLLSSVMYRNLVSKNSQVLVKGTPIGSSPVVLSYHTPYTKANPSMISPNLFSTILDIQISGNTMITVSGGTIYDTAHPETKGERITLVDDSRLCWTFIDEFSSSGLTLTVVSEKTVDTYVLKKVKETGIWTISQE